MSEENVEIARQMFERWQDGGGSFEAIPIEMYAEDVEWDLSGYPLVDLPTQGKGKAELLDTVASYLSGWTSYQPEASEYIDAGENVIVVLHEKASIAGSEVLLERDVFQTWTLRDSLVVKWRVFETREAALEAAGLEE